MQKTFEVAGAVEAEIHLAAGDVLVETGEPGRVDVDLVAHDEESQRAVDAARVELANGRLIVDVPLRKGGFGLALVFGRGGIDCRVRCPEGSNVTARTKSADVTTRGALGAIEVATASGDVRTDRSAGPVTVKSASGDAAIGDTDGNVSVQTASGDVELGAVGGTVTVQTASGDLTVVEARGDVSASTVSGDQHLLAVSRGRVASHAVSGDVTIGVRRGSAAYLDCSSTSGDTSSDLDGLDGAPDGERPLVEIRAKTVSGDIRIVRAAAPASEEEVHA